MLVARQRVRRPVKPRGQRPRASSLEPRWGPLVLRWGWALAPALYQFDDSDADVNLLAHASAIAQAAGVPFIAGAGDRVPPELIDRIHERIGKPFIHVFGMSEGPCANTRPTDPPELVRRIDEESQSLAMLIDFIGKPVSLQVETQYSQEQFDIVLM